MLKDKRILLGAAALFVAVEILFGVLLQCSSYVALFSFLSVVLACLFCALFAARSKSYTFTQLALACTVGADYFLVVCSPRVQLPAMLFFSVTQLCYAARLYFEEESRLRRRVHLACRAIGSVLAVSLTLAVLGKGADAVAVVSVFYYAHLLLNIVFAFLRFRRVPLLAVGFVLFACCDTLIGFSFLGDYFTLSPDAFIYKLLHPGFDLAWACYLPSQVLLALSLLPERLRKKKEKV